MNLYTFFPFLWREEGSADNLTKYLLYFNYLGFFLNLPFSERNLLELATARLLKSLILYGRRNTLALDHRFLQKLEIAIGSQGLSALCNEEIKQTVVSLIIYVLKNMSQSIVRSMVCLPTLEAFASHAIAIIGSHGSCEVSFCAIIHYSLVFSGKLCCCFFF